jgi:hypothetical protein
MAAPLVEFDLERKKTMPSDTSSDIDFASLCVLLFMGLIEFSVVACAVLIVLWLVFPGVMALLTYYFFGG